MTVVSNEAARPVCDSLIGWIGGKDRLRATIINCMPPHFCYVEIFCGSASIFFGKDPKQCRVEIINDVHEDLVNLMKVISGTYFDDAVRDEFIGYVRGMPAARAVFEDWKHWGPDELEKLSPAQRAFRFYYCVKKGFSSSIQGGYEASPFAVSRYNQNTDFEPFTERFRANNAQIERLDFRELIRKYNRTVGDRKKPAQETLTFFVGDPPYFIDSLTHYYHHGFSRQDHEDLRKCCNEITKNGNKFLLTYDDVPETIELYSGFYIYRTDPIIYKSAHEDVKRELSKTELIITNYDIAQLIRERNTSGFSDASLRKGRPFGTPFEDEEQPSAEDDGRIEIPGHLGLQTLETMPF